MKAFLRRVTPRFQTTCLQLDLRDWQEVSPDTYAKLPAEYRGTFEIQFFNLFGRPICYSSRKLRA